jgi:hypothetical protein
MGGGCIETRIVIEFGWFRKTCRGASSKVRTGAVDEYATEDNPVRVVDVFIDELDLGTPGAGLSRSVAESSMQ